MTKHYVQDPGDRPFILIVDDEPDDIRSRMEELLEHAADVEVVHPSDLRIAELVRADLVLVDYRLEEWPKRDRQIAAFQIKTGLGLAPVLRELVDEAAAPRGGVRALGHRASFALHTAHLEMAKGRIRLPSPSASHVLARLNNLEWVFEKQDPSQPTQMLELARATRCLPAEWPDAVGDSESRAAALLGLHEGDPWYDRCWRDVLECQPPIHELAGGAGGVLFLRWLLHQILPFPSFLWDEHWVAARLGLSVSDLRRVLTSDSELSRDLASGRYSGLLADFLGNRWWRGAVEDYSWELAGRSGGGASEFQKEIRKKAGEELTFVEFERPVVCLDKDLQPSARFASPSEAVNVHPDHWPAFAGPAWMRISTLSEVPEMRAIVDPLDVYRIADEG